MIKVITYLAFTLLSVVTQFTLMDLIQDTLHVQYQQSDLNHTTRSHRNREEITHLVKDITNKPHALYYRSNEKKNFLNLADDLSSEVYSNTTLSNAFESTTTGIISTVFEVFEDDNSTTVSTSTEEFVTSTELQNITEESIFSKKNNTFEPTTKPNKATDKRKCICNLLVNACDTQCCCDPDCSAVELGTFASCSVTAPPARPARPACYPHVSFGEPQLDSLFCLAATNLPDKKTVVLEYTPATINKLTGETPKWPNKPHTRASHKFVKKPYADGDPIWILKNNKIYYLDMPSPMVNGFCTSRKPMRFLRDDHVACRVQLRDLEMMRLTEHAATTVVSVTSLTYSSETMNCSTLYCANWTLLHCDDATCTPYNHTLHEPSCNETVCTNIAQTITYEFYYYHSKIINTTVRLHTDSVSTGVPYLTQRLAVRFYFTNVSIDLLVRLSGNPGYVDGLPVLASIAKSNFSSRFFSVTDRNIVLPSNKNGECFWTNDAKNSVLFGSNKRFKCRFRSNRVISLTNDISTVCDSFQKDIISALKMNSDLFVSPYGNPAGLGDEQWIRVGRDIIGKVKSTGETNEETSKLRCYNVVTEFRFVHAFADVGGSDGIVVNKILSVKFDVGTQDVQFDPDDPSVVLTVDYSFVDVTSPPLYRYAASPHLNIHLPKDFFFPFPNKGVIVGFHCLVYVIVILLCTIFK